MKQWFVLLIILPTLTLAQSKKQKKAQEKADKQTIYNLTAHIKYLADDKLEGRRAGTKGELLAMEYISQQFKKIGIEAKGTVGFTQEFDVNEGKYIDSTATFFKVDEEALQLNKEYFPLSLSSNTGINDMASPALNEKGHLWFWDVKETINENKDNPHFDIFSSIKNEMKRVSEKGAKALIIYNSTNSVDNIQFYKNEKNATATIPVIYVTAVGLKKFFKDRTKSYAIDLNIHIAENRRKAYNVIGYINNKASNTIILGAHYDHLGYGEDRNSRDGYGQIHNGADDNASGTAALIELARRLKAGSIKNNNYLFIAFSAEELGLYGSKYWLDSPTIHITPNYMINMDMIGRYDSSRKLTVGGYGTSPVWGETFSSIKTDLKIKFDSSGTGPSDYNSFYRKSIPVVFLFTNSHEDYHKSTDDWDKINYEGELHIIKLVQQIITQTNNKGKLAFTKTRDQEMGRSTSFTVSLGIIPDYSFTGKGLRIDGISKGKIAERIGLQTGNILLQLGEYKFVDVQTYMQVLSKFKKGDSTKLRVKKGNEEKEFDITF